MSSRAAVLAFAAPLLFSAPALADHGRVDKRGGASVSIHTGNGSLQLNVGDHGRYGYRSYGYNTGRHHGYRVNQFGQSPDEVRYLRRQAVRACRSAIRREADYIGFRDVDFDDGRFARQIGPAGFLVTFNEVEFEGRRRDFERQVTCEVRRGTNVVRIDGLPQPGRRGHRQYNSGYRY